MCLYRRRQFGRRQRNQASAAADDDNVYEEEEYEEEEEDDHDRLSPSYEAGKILTYRYTPYKDVSCCIALCERIIATWNRLKITIETVMMIYFYVLPTADTLQFSCALYLCF